MAESIAEKKPLPTYEPVGYIDLLRRNRTFRQLWLGQVVSQMGDWFDTIALYTIILNLPVRAVTSDCCSSRGLCRVFSLVRCRAWLPIGFSRQRIMIVSDILRAVVVLGFSVCAPRGSIVDHLCSDGFPTRTLHLLRTRQNRRDSFHCGGSRTGRRERDLVGHVVGDAHARRGDRRFDNRLVRHRCGLYSRRRELCLVGRIDCQHSRAKTPETRTAETDGKVVRSASAKPSTAFAMSKTGRACSRCCS